MIDEWTLRHLASGRLNINEILTVHEVRFWLEIRRGNSEVLRYSEFRSPETELRTVLKAYDLPEYGWHAEILPSPIKVASGTKDLQASEVLSSDDPWTVANAGLMPGSILRIVLDN